MERRQFLIAATAVGGVAALPIFAQPARQIPRVLFLSSSTEKAYGPLLAEFIAGMGAQGQAQDRSYVLEARWGDERLERLPAMIAEGLSLNPAVIVTHGSAAVALLQKATKTVPIVFASVGDPVGQGFVASFRRPGGNITGVAFNDEVNKKLYELVKRVIPQARRVATLVNPGNPASKHHLEIVPATSKALGLEPLVLNATSADDLAAAFSRAVAMRAQAVIATPMAPFIGLRAQIIELQFKHGIATFWGVGEGAQDGGVASYHFPFSQSFRRAGALADKVLKGEKPGEIAVEIPAQYEIAINARSAAKLGINIAPSVLMRADRVIQ